MGPIVIGLDPAIIRLGHFALSWYGLFIALGILAAFWFAGREAQRRGMDAETISTLGLWGILGGIIGARFFHLIDNWPTYAANPGAIFAIQNGGLAIWGGIVGGAIAGGLYARLRGLPLGIMADIAAPALILGQAIGRIGCLVNGDSLGPPTNLPWGFVYTNPMAMAPQLGVAFQPTPLYEMLWDILILTVLWKVRDRFRVPGQLFLLYVMLFAVDKFSLTFLRQEVVLAFGLQEAQLVSLIALVIAIPLFIYIGRRGTRSTPAPRFSAATAERR